MTYVGRDHRGRVVFRDDIVGYAEQPLLIPHGGGSPQGAAPASNDAPPALDPDLAWADIYAAIWAFTEHWLSVARNMTPSENNDRVMRMFLAEWSPLLTRRQEFGPRLGGDVAYKGRVVITVGRALQQLVLRAHQLGIPDPPIDVERDRSWLYLTPDTQFATTR